MSISAETRRDLEHDIATVFYNLRSGLSLLAKSLSRSGIELNVDPTLQPRDLESQAKIGSALCGVLRAPEVPAGRIRTVGRPPDLVDVLRSAARICVEGHAGGWCQSVVIDEEPEDQCPIDVDHTILEESLVFLLNRIRANALKVQVRKGDGKVVAQFEFHRAKFQNAQLQMARSRIKSLGATVAKSINGADLLIAISFTAMTVQEDATP